MSIAEMHIDEDGILHIKILEGAHITIEKSKKYYDLSRQLLGDKKALVLVDGSMKFTITKEARIFAASAEASAYRVASAVVTNSIINKLIVNWYIRFNKPVVPTKLFSSKESALKWLKTFYVMPGDKYLKPRKNSF